MSIAVPTGRLGTGSPRTRARITGIVYLLFFLTAILGSIVAPGISGPGSAADAATIATNIMAHPAAFRIGWALDLVSTAFYVALMALLYLLFRPVSRMFALLAAFFGLVGCAVTAVGTLFLLGPLLILGAAPLLGYLIFESGFLPRILGPLVALAGLDWLTFLSPPLANQLLTPLEVLGIVAEGALMLWLLVRGVDSRRWLELAA